MKAALSHKSNHKSNHKLQADKVILALDVDSFARAKYFVDKLCTRIKIFKVGLQIFTLCGPEIIKYIRKKKAEVFLDLKFYDIPNTVSNAVRQAVRLNVKMMTLHISGGREMLKRAQEAAKEEARFLKIERPLLIGVTVLTSQPSTAEEVLNLAKIGLDCGLDGVVCSAREVAFLKEKLDRKFIAITPGIRPPGSARDDQKRTMTAKEALAAGSDFIVVGRPILEAKDPVDAAERLIWDQVQNAVGTRSKMRLRSVPM